MARRVLLVDDDAAIRQMYAMALEQAGLSVTVAPDGEQAVAAIRKELPEVVVLDLEMPRLDGISVLAWMRKDAGLDIPVLVLTNTAGQEQADQARRLGISGFLIKSVTLPRQLIRIIEALGSGGGGPATRFATRESKAPVQFAARWDLWA